MADEYISKADVMNLPQSIERNLRGEIVERSIDVKDIEALEPADVVPVVHGRWVKYTGMDRVSRMDKKTITETLKRCSGDAPYNCRNCPYNKNSGECISDLMRDALALIGVLETNGEE